MAQVEREANRRGSRRRAPKGSTKVHCYRGLIGCGPDVAHAVLDISETGASLLLKAPFKTGERLEVNLESIAHRRPVKKMASVIWCVPAGEDRYVVGVKFEGTLPYSDLNDLTRM